MTAPSGKFVDIRFPKAVNTAVEAVKHPSWWVFSGHVTTRFYDQDLKSDPNSVALPYTAHCVFEQDIDSRGLSFVDEGDMFTLQNGDCLEVGSMLNSVTGKEEIYKEYWTSAPPLPGMSNDEAENKFTVVASAHLDGVLKGNAIRVGGRIQGVILHQEGGQDVVKAVRWERVASSQTDASFSEDTAVPGVGWSRDSRSNTDLPCKWLCRAEVTVGDVFEFEGLKWQINEIA